jgi:hypothetical protein
MPAGPLQGTTVNVQFLLILLLLYFVAFGTRLGAFTSRRWKDFSSLQGLASTLPNLTEGRYDVCVVGLSSMVIVSDRYATHMNQSVLVLKKRNPACRDRVSNRNPGAIQAFYDHIDLTCAIVRTWHVCPAQPNMTDRVAVIKFQSGFDVALYAYIIRATMRRLGPRWALQVFYGSDNIKVELMMSLDHPSNVVWTPLRIQGKRRDKISYVESNWLMLSPEFWRAVSHEHVLLFEGQTLLLKHLCIESFLNYSFVGGPWQSGLGGNGGFSLRRRSSMLAAVENIELRSACPLSDPEGCPCPGQRRGLQLCEDLLFTHTLSRMYGDSAFPNRSFALGFSVETQKHPDPCGFHAPWKHVGPAETQRMLGNVDMDVSWHHRTTECGHVQQHLIALASYHDSRALVYRCRPFDDCGGLGDRFAGILGAALLSLSLGRSLKIDWPDLQHAFLDKENIWSYDEKWLNVSRVPEYKSPSPYESSFTDLSADVGVLSMLNTFRFLDNPSQQNWAPSKRILFFHSNRACSQSQYQAWKNQQGVLANQKAPLLEVYRCIFNTLFAIKPSFSDRIVPLISDPTRLTLGNHLRLARSENMFSIAIQVRISDEDIRRSASLKQMNYTPWAYCVNACVNKITQRKSTIVYVFSNSKDLSQNLMDHIKLAANYSKVFAPLILGEVHTNAREFKNKTDIKTNSKLAFTSAMSDWILMRNANVLIYSPASGFPTSAAVFSDSTQKHVDLDTCKEITRDRDEHLYCTGRYC